MAVNISKLRAQARMRSLAGHTIARQGTGADGYMRKYMHRATGGRCVEVEGNAAPQRMDRPARKWGGRTKPKMNDHDADDYAKGGMVKGHQDTDDGKGGWADKDGTKRPDGGGFARGGFLSGMKKGALRKSLNVPEGETIPAKKLEKAEHSDNPTLKKRAVLAETMKSWKHGKR